MTYVSDFIREYKHPAGTARFWKMLILPRVSNPATAVEGPKMNAIICSILVLAVIGWVLRVNANDRRLFEKELDDADS